ncbi:hypothetical protein Abac_002_011 [Acetobacter aceti NBRC 14818]|nr:hypothetical protein Abac_002_011 [Acetobacter aceti NBRC 14818]
MDDDRKKEIVALLKGRKGFRPQNRDCPGGEASWTGWRHGGDGDFPGNRDGKHDRFGLWSKMHNPSHWAGGNGDGASRSASIENRHHGQPVVAAFDPCEDRGLL